MTDIKTIASKGLREPKVLAADEIKQIAEYVTKEAHANAKEVAIARKALHDLKSVTADEVKELSAHVLGEGSHSRHKS